MAPGTLGGTMRWILALAVAAAMVSTSAQAADKADFTSCDGYPPPTGSGDGIISDSFLFGLAGATSDMRRSREFALGAPGLEACDRALADDKRLKPKFTLRRANLLQARVLHLAALGQFVEALKALDAVEAMAPQFDARYWDIGLGLGDRAIRAYIYGKTGHPDEAAAQIAAIRAARPYSPNVQALADKLELPLMPGMNDYLARLSDRAAIDPGGVIVAFLIDLQYGSMADAARIGAGLSLDLPKGRGGWTILGEETRQYEQIEQEAELAGSYAYALAASGKPEAAQTRLVEANLALGDAMAPPPPPEQGKTIKASVQRDYDQRVMFGNRGKQRIDLWSKLIDFRLAAPGMKPDDLMKRLQTFDPKDMPVIVDVMQVANLGPESESGQMELIQKSRAAIERNWRNQVDPSLRSIAQFLPRPESDQNRMRFKHSGDGYFVTDNGYSRRRMDSDDDWTVRATDLAASGPTLEEAAVLSAALFARDKGYDRLLIQSRRVFQRETHVMSYGYTSSIQNSGREAQLRVRLVKSGEVPADIEGTQWRTLDVGKAIADLTPRFAD